MQTAPTGRATRSSILPKPRGRKSGIAPATGSPARWGMSRPLSEEVTFDRAKIISPDRLCYSIPDITEFPETVGRRRPRQRGLRRDRRAPAPRALDPGAPQTGVGLKRRRHIATDEGLGASLLF